VYFKLAVGVKFVLSVDVAVRLYSVTVAVFIPFSLYFTGVDHSLAVIVSVPPLLLAVATVTHNGSSVPVPYISFDQPLSN